jgi:iron complex outermembrane receptor protein
MFKIKSNVFAAVCLSPLLFVVAPVFAEGAPSADLAAPVAATEAPTAQVSEVVVFGVGQSREVQTLLPVELNKATPGTSPLETLGKLPGVDFESSDPLGAYEWAQQVTIRGFITNQLGYTLDGIPLGNMDYRNNNGLSIGRALETENNGAVTLSQGSGALGTASTSNIGGVIDYTSLAPTHDRGVDIDQTYGSDNIWRTFIRFNTGDLSTGGRLFISYDHQAQDKWKGYGEQTQDQMNIKVIQPISENISSTTYVDMIARKEDDYADMSLDLVRRLGYNVDDITANYKLAQTLAYEEQNGLAASPPFENPDDVYYDSGEVRQDFFAYEKLLYAVDSHLSGETNAYVHLDHGIGTFADPYDPTPAAYGGSPISQDAVLYDIAREGIISKLRYKIGQHDIEGGLWFEDNDFHQREEEYGFNLDSAPTDFEQFYSNPFNTVFNNKFNTKTYQFHVGDTWSINDSLRVNAGFKSLVSKSTAKTIFSDQPVNGSIEAANGFLPTVGVLYRLDAHNEIFSDYTRNMAAFTASTSSGPFSTTQAGFDYIRGDLKPETTDTVELGYRLHTRTIQASLTGYDVEFQNRLLASSISSVIVGNQNVLQNVGSVTSRGVEAALNWKLARSWSVYGTWAYDDAHYNDNVVIPSTGEVVDTRGKSVVAAPRNTGNLQLSYDDGSLWGQVGAHYHDKRYYTYTNDSPISGATVVNLSAGYRSVITHPQFSAPLPAL